MYASGTTMSTFLMRGFSAQGMRTGRTQIGDLAREVAVSVYRPHIHHAWSRM
jgi:hypothetical protein